MNQKSSIATWWRKLPEQCLGWTHPQPGQAPSNPCTICSLPLVSELPFLWLNSPQYSLYFVSWSPLSITLAHSQHMGILTSSSAARTHQPSAQIACPTLITSTTDYTSWLCYTQPFLPLHKLYLLAFPALWFVFIPQKAAVSFLFPLLAQLPIFESLMALLN